MMRVYQSISAAIAKDLASFQNPEDADKKRIRVSARARAGTNYRRVRKLCFVLIISLLVTSSPGAPQAIQGLGRDLQTSVADKVRGNYTPVNLMQALQQSYDRYQNWVTALASGRFRRSTSNSAHPESMPAPPVILVAPSNLTVNSTSSTVIQLSWTAPGGIVNHYMVERSQSMSGPFNVIAQTPSPSYADNVTNGTAYLYRVRAVDSFGSPSPPSTMSLGTAISFADPELHADVSEIKAQHIYDLRQAIDAVRALAELGATTWTDGTLTGGVPVQALHVRQLRDRLGEALAVLSVPVGSYVDANLATGVSGTPIRKIHIEQLRLRATRGTSTSTGPGPTISDSSTARLDPANRTGGGGEDPLSRNFNWSVPLVGLPGRAGLDLGLSLSYNSLVWTRSGSFISFDDDRGFPSPGFRLGFPVIHSIYFNSEVGKNAFLLITPNGERVELRQVGSSNLYEAADSSHLLLDSASMILRTTDGTQLSYVANGSEFQCTQIKDRNGNFITINYTAFGRIDTVVDTLSRTVKFNYDGNQYLTSITQTWTVNGAPHTHNWARFEYRNPDLPIQTNFSGLTNLGPQNGTTLKVLAKVTLADDSHFDFDYTSWGQIWKVSNFAADNHLLNYRAYNLPGSELLASSAQTDCPRFTERHDWAENWNRSGPLGPANLPVGAEQEVKTSYAIPVVASWTPPNSAEQTGMRAEVIVANNTDQKTTHRIYFQGFAGTSSGWRRGLATLVETFDSADVLQKQSVTTWTQDNTAVSYILNPRVTESNVYDPAGNRKRITINYGPAEKGYEQWGLPYLVTEYAANGTAEIRHNYIDYNLSQEYLDRRIIGLVSARHLSDTSTWQSIVYFSYDAGGSQLVATPLTTIQHDPAYGVNLTMGRGNLTAVTRYDVFDIDNADKRLTTQMGYDTNGSLVFARDPADHQNSISYGDAFSANGTNLDASRSFATFAYPTTVTDADGYSSSTRYHYDFGAPTWKQTPMPNLITNTPGPEQKLTYDDKGRIERITNLVNNAYTRFIYGPNYVEGFASVNNVADEAHSLQVFDGAGRIIAEASNHPGSTGGFSGQLLQYDVMGRVIKQSNPTETSISISGASIHPYNWSVAGDDAPANQGFGWLYTDQNYDWKGRPRIITNTDGATKDASYSGCGCAGGEVVTLTDEGTLDSGTPKRRQQKIYSDVLGRTVKTEVLNWQGGTEYSTTVNTYNARDQLTLVRQFQGTAPSDPQDLSCPSGTCQQISMTYDGHGRPKTSHVPEQQVDSNNPASTDHTTWDYNTDDTIQKITDARGAVTNYTFNNRHQVTNITYTLNSGVPTTGSSAVLPTAPSTYGYDAAGNRISMSDGSGTVSYQFNQLSRMTSEARQFTGLFGTYTVAYDYNLAGTLKSITDPTGATINYTIDSVGRTSAVTGSSFGGVTQYASNIQYRAWNGLKGMSYGNTRTASATYNARLQATHFEIPGVMSKDYQYHADGRLRFSANPMDTRFDRSYGYDHVGRMSEAFSGPLARGEADTNDRPYKQFYQYDAMNNLVGRVGSRHWNLFLRHSGTDPYLNNRNTTWQYDADGRLTSSDEIQNAHDAAGRVTTVVSNSGNQTQTRIFDGDGQTTKIVESVNEDDGEGGMITTTTTRYKIVSRVIGALLTDLDETGQKTRTLVYSGRQVLAWQQKVSGSETVLWEYRDPSNASHRMAVSDGTVDVSRVSEMDPMGSNAGRRNPYLFPPSHWPREDLTYPAFADMISGDCSIDGIPAPCSLAQSAMASGAAEQCPNNECSRINPNTGQLEFFHSYSDGRSGYLDVGATYLGNGLVNSPSAGSIEEDELSGYLYLEPSPQKPPTPSGCARFVDRLMKHVDKVGASVTLRKIAIGVAMAYEANNDLAKQAKAGKLDYSGFKGNLIAGEQNGWAMVHIQGMAGASLAGAIDVIDKQFRQDKNQLKVGLDWKAMGRREIPYEGDSLYPIDKYIAEKQAEIADDHAGIMVAGFLSQKIDRRSWVLTKVDIFNLLCDR